MKKNKINKKKIVKQLKKNKIILKEPAEKVASESGDESVAKLAKGVKTFSLLRGMRDILPKEELYWKKVYRTAEEISTAYNFGYLETPILEDAGLFIRSLGRGTDVVDKEMYTFEDRDGTKVGMRPEATVSAARSYVNHGMHTVPQPVKFWYYGPMFRHDKPQAGRYREFHQFGCETFGGHEAVLDAELIVVGYNFFRDLGINVGVHINSIGTTEDRQRYVVELVGYLRSKRSYLCEDCKKRLVKNPLRVLDCKEEQCQPILDEAPQIIDWLSDQSRAYFMKVLEYLDELDIPYVLKPTLVRGLDYYTDTVFEFYKEEGEEGAQSALGGGGRYDLLVEQVGGLPTPGCGFAIGVERTISVMRKQTEEKGLIMDDGRTKIFFAQLGEQARRKSLLLIENLRREGIKVYHNLGKASLKGQMELADKNKVLYTLILGQKEVQDGTIIIRDMESGIQEIVDQKKLKQQLDKKLLNLTK